MSRSWACTRTRIRHNDPKQIPGNMLSASTKVWTTTISEKPESKKPWGSPGQGSKPAGDKALSVSYKDSWQGPTAELPRLLRVYRFF